MIDLFERALALAREKAHPPNVKPSDDRQLLVSSYAILRSQRITHCVGTLQIGFDLDQRTGFRSHRIDVLSRM